MLMHTARGLSIAIGLALSAGTAVGQDYPNKLIRLISAGAGGGTEFTARLLAEGLTGPLGQPIIVENRVGVAPGESVSKAAPDGYMLLITGGTHWLRPLMEKTPYDPVRDFAPITLATFEPLVLLVHPSLPVKSVQELIALAKAKPGVLNVGTTQTGTQIHLAYELLKSMTEINAVRITYKSNAQLITDLMGDHVQVAFLGGTGAMPQVNAGRLRALAVTSLNPTPLIPSLPTVAASGLPGFEAGSEFSVFAPAKTPAAILTRLSREMVLFLKKAETKERLLNVGMDVVASSPDELAAKINSEINIWGKIIKNAGIKVD